MFSCCVPVSRSCRLRGARGCDASRPWRQWVRSCTGRLRSLARRDPKKSTDEIGKRLAESHYTCPTELCVCPVAQKGHPGPRERVAARRSWEAGPGDRLGRPPSAPQLRRKVLVHRSWDQYLEPPEPDPEGQRRKRLFETTTKYENESVPYEKSVRTQSISGEIPLEGNLQSRSQVTCWLSGPCRSRPRLHPCLQRRRGPRCRWAGLWSHTGFCSCPGLLRRKQSDGCSGSKASGDPRTTRRHHSPAQSSSQSFHPLHLWLPDGTQT
ncbi:uncharacterized protein LOC122236265 [Panthera tigris]|uniref:uncharacterized protein LOC122233057 n=1 Tax=Panthera tigris TaxID=9694 RepID=UPI001C6F87DD|nr:uncharacterized protein LOC122233057 [Panthera tigris]XP_042833066.1 uncharacterized protein LOC122236265 [Panthera tigris]